MRHVDLRLQALAAELDACREALRDAVDAFHDDRARQAARLRRVLAVGLFVFVLVGGFITGDSRSYGASPAHAVRVTCAPGSGSIANASFSYDGTASVTATFTITAGCTATVSLAVYELVNAPLSSMPQKLFATASVTATGGTHSLTVALPPCFWQADLMTVTPPATLDPATDHETWARAHAATAIGAVGGTQACVHVPPPTTTTHTTTTETTGTTTTTTTPTTTTTTTTPTTTTITTPTTTTHTTTTVTTATTGTSTTQTTVSTSTPTTTATTTPSTTTTTPQTTPPPASPLTDVAVTKVPDKTNAVVGQQISYLLTVTNNGPGPAEAVVLVDELPTEESLVSVSDTACTGTQVITCNFGTLAAGASRSVTVVTLARSPGTAVNPATVTTTTPETTTANNRAQASVPITGPFVPPKTQCAAVSVQHGALVAGHQVTVDVTAKRNGDAASGVRVSLHGPGIDVTKATDSGGHARFVVAPKSVGVLRIQVAQSADCATPPQEIPIPGAFKPPRLTG